MILSCATERYLMLQWSVWQCDPGKRKGPQSSAAACKQPCVGSGGERCSWIMYVPKCRWEKRTSGLSNGTSCKLQLARWITISARAFAIFRMCQFVKSSSHLLHFQSWPRGKCEWQDAWIKIKGLHYQKLQKTLKSISDVWWKTQSNFDRRTW